MKEVLNRVKDTLASHKSLDHVEYPGEEIAVKDQIEVVLKR